MSNVRFKALSGVMNNCIYCFIYFIPCKRFDVLRSKIVIQNGRAMDAVTKIGPRTNPACPNADVLVINVYPNTQLVKQRGTTHRIIFSRVSVLKNLTKKFQ